MGKNVFWVFLVLFLFFSWAPAEGIRKTYAQIYRDPFEPQLPQMPVEIQASEQVEQQKEVLPPPVNIEGILWAGEASRVIIDGEVYKTGDKIEALDATVHKIGKENISILYQGKLFEMKIMKKDIGKWERK